MAMHSYELFVVDSPDLADGSKFYGDVVNTFSHVGVDHIEFNMALFGVLSASSTEPDIGHPSVPVSFAGLSPNNRNQFMVVFPPVHGQPASPTS
jgi:hypothetical protein